MAHLEKTVKRNAKHVKIQTVVVSVARALMGVLLDIAVQILDVQKNVCTVCSFVLMTQYKPLINLFY